MPTGSLVIVFVFWFGPPLPVIPEAVCLVDKDHIKLVSKVLNLVVREILELADTHHV